MRVYSVRGEILVPVFRLAGRGFSDGEIANRLNTSEENVRRCVAWIMHILEFSDRIELIHYAAVRTEICAGEALGLEIKHIAPDFRTLYIRQKAKRSELQGYLKTKNGERDVDLCSSLAAMLREFVGGRTEGLLFRSSTGAQLLQSNTLQDSLHPILKNIEHAKGGFNMFRRYRITHLQKAECPEALRHFWSGHAPRHVSERYTKLREERDFRLEWAEKIGLGFDLPTAPNGQLGQPARILQFRKVG